MADSYVAGGFLYHAPSGRVLLQHRTADAPTYPSKWGAFGGGDEPEDNGNPVTTWRREVLEELELSVEPTQVIALDNYEVRPGYHRYVFYYPWAAADQNLKLHEGQGFGWFPIEEALATLDLTPNARRDLLTLSQRLAGTS